MSRIFGIYRQNGYIVKDLETAIKYWTEKMGVGPFFIARNLELKSFTYCDSNKIPSIDIALANLGDIQIELIQPNDDTPSPYLNFLKTKGPGMHHISVWSDDYDNLVAKLLHQGFSRDCHGEVSNGVRFSFFDSAKTEGTTMEIADSRTPGFKELSEAVRIASRDWDGTRPVRGLEDLHFN